MLSEIKISIDDLCLDPNNPRLNYDLNIPESIPDKEIVSKQTQLLKQFKNVEASDDEDVTSIKVLYDSMTTIGFVPIDRVVVRSLRQTKGKYLVIEGNRRVATAKQILKDYKSGYPPFELLQKQKKLEPLLKSFRNITCMLLETDGRAEQDVTHDISIILGLRHHGSLLEWDPLSKAYSVYKTYKSIEPKITRIVFENSRQSNVASRLSIKPSVVKNSLKTYVAFLQLKENFTVLDKYYSLIQEGVTNNNLDGCFISTDRNTYELDDQSIENMNRVCQFETRDSIPDGKKRILDEPKSFRQLGKLFNMQKKATEESIKQQAKDLIALAVDEDEVDMTLDDAVDLLNDFIKKSEWIETLNAELEKQHKTLSIDDYSGTGNDRGNKDTLRATLEPLKRMLGI